MTWRRLGRIFCSDGTFGWMVSHAANPVPRVLPDGTVEVLFSARDGQGRARIAALHMVLTPLPMVVRVFPNPVLDLGALGAFDDSGVTSACLVESDGRLYNYYTGWTLGVSVPFYFYVGLAISEDGGRQYARTSMAPILDRSEVDPFLTAAPCVLLEHGLWRMWYVSGSRWEMVGNKAKHYYHIRYAESRDGIHWQRTGRVCIDYASPSEFAFGRPWVVHDPGVYRMWYSVRGTNYRLGYAESIDGFAWVRMDERVGLAPSDSGWDSEMLAYPSVFDQGGTRFMLYNGNDYGRSGLGVAVLEGF